MKSNTKLTVVEDITNYLDFLRRLGYEVSLCNLNRIFRTCYDDLLLYVGHENERCLRVKENEKFSCLKYQDELINFIGVDNFGPFTCFAGVSEYVFPIEYKSERYGIICFNYGAKKKAVDGLTSQEKKTAKAVIKPLCHMFEILLERLTQSQDYFEEYVGAQKTCYKVVEFIENNLDRPFTLKEICDYAHYSQSFISREFKKIYAKSVMDYAIDYKIKSAKRFLEKTDLSISEVAFKVGYYNPNDFTAIFKKREGISPREYRLVKIKSD